MSVKTFATLLVVVGAIGLVLALAANPLRIGNNPNEFGGLQTLGTALGIVMVLVGVWLARRQGTGKRP